MNSRKIHRFQKRIGLLILSALVLQLPLSLQAAPNNETEVENEVTIAKGTISGKILDDSNAHKLSGVTITVSGEGLKSTTDMDGHYTIKDVPEGIHKLVIYKRGYQLVRVTDVEVEADEVARLNYNLKKKVQTADVDDGIIMLEAVTVTSSIVQGSDLGLIASRQKAVTISDAVGLEDFSRFGAGDAAAAMKRVTGVSVVGGKYTYVRGLGERYSNTTMNGATMASADPNKKAVQMDLFPTDFLESIVTSKTFTPDKPGDFAGGNVDIQTKSFPDQKDAKISTSFKYNTNTTNNADFMTYNGGSSWLAEDDGTRELPSIVKTAIDEGAMGNPRDLSNRNEDAWNYFSDLINAFDSQEFAPHAEKASPGYGVNMHYGDTYELSGDQKLGFVLSFNYDQDYSFYDNGISARYESSSLDNDGSLNPVYVFDDSKSQYTVTLGGFANVAYQPSKNHEISLNLFYNRVGEDVARVRQSTVYDKSGVTAPVTQYDLHYTERAIQQIQLSGKSYFEDLDLRLKWNLSQSGMTQSEPDKRIFGYYEVSDGTVYRMAENSNILPERYWRDLDDTKMVGKFDLEKTFDWFGEGNTTLKTGYFYSGSEREYQEYGLQYKSLGSSDYNDYDFGADEDINRIFNEQSLGVLWDDTDGLQLGSDEFGYYLFQRNNDYYEGTEDINALYLMGDFRIAPKWLVSTGVRAEKTEMYVYSPTITESDWQYPDIPFTNEGEIDQWDYMPAFNLTYNATENANIRFAVSQTIARPTLREFAPYASEGGVDEAIVGNPNLELSSINNYDLRWEWFPRKGEVVAVSVFYKTLDQAIEKTINIVNGGFYAFSYENVNEGEIAGIEFEFRKDLSFIHESLEHFSLNANFTYTDSKVSVSDEAMARAAAKYDNDISQVPDTRRLFGQPERIANVSLSYDNTDLGTAVSVNYNFVSDRLDSVSYAKTPDIFEADRYTLDLVFKQRILGNWNLKLSAKNLTNTLIEKYYDSAFKETFSSYKEGTTYSISLSYTFF